MKQIEAFVDSVYQNIGGNKKEIQELKAEMQSHLLEAVHELKSEGKSEQEAIEIAIERFGGEKEMRSIVSQLFKAQKVFANWVLYTAITFLVLSLILFVFFYQNTHSNMNDLSVTATEVNSILKNKETVSNKMKQDISALIEKTNYISEISIYPSKKIRSEGENWVSYDTELINPDYQYKRSLSSLKWLGADIFLSGNGDEHWYVEMKYKTFNTLQIVILFVGISVYCTLFSIWAIINAYHHRRLNVGWIIAFVLFNVIGYLVYFLVGKRTETKTLYC